MPDRLDLGQGERFLHIDTLAPNNLFMLPQRPGYGPQNRFGDVQRTEWVLKFRNMGWTGRARYCSQRGNCVSKKPQCYWQLRGSDACSKTRHDDDNRHLHRALERNGVEVSLHPKTDLFHVGIDLLQFQADENVDWRQEP